MAIFPAELDVDSFASEPWNAVSEAKELLSAFDFSQHFRELAKESNSVNANSAVMAALSDVLSFHLVPTDRAQPYRPLAIFGDKRSLAVEDLVAGDIEILESLAPLCRDPMIRAYLADVAWVAGRNSGRKSWSLGPLAARSYLEAVQRADRLGDVILFTDELQRGLQLAWEFRKQDTDCLGVYWIYLIALSRESAAKGETAVLCHALRTFVERRHEQCGEMAAVAEAAARDAEERLGATPAIPDLWAVIADLWRIADNPNRARAARLAQGEALVAIGQQGATSAMAAAHWLQKGLNCLRRAKASPARIDGVHRQLLEQGEASLAELGQISTSFDGTEAINAARRHVADRTFGEALLRFAFGHGLIDPGRVRERVEELARKSPLSYLIESKAISADGKTIGVRPSLMATGSAYEEAIRQAVIEHASRMDFAVRAQLFILPARDQLWNDHHPSFSDLSSLVASNPLIPPDHEEAYLRGLVAGFLGDWVVAAHMLIPQVEASLRHVLSKVGAITSSVQPDGIQEELKLHQLLDLPEAVTVFGGQVIFEIRVLTVEALGANLRNRFAHGLFGSSDCNSYDVVNLWWLLLRLCSMPALKASQQKRTET